MKSKYIVVGILVLLSIVALMLIAGEMSAYATFEVAEKNPDKKFQIVGQLSKDKDIIYNPEVDANLFTFYMKDKNEVERKIIFIGAKPTDFERSEEIVLTGRMVGEEFKATKMLMKCPSKYTEEEIQLKEMTY